MTSLKPHIEYMSKLILSALGPPQSQQWLGLFAPPLPACLCRGAGTESQLIPRAQLFLTNLPTPPQSHISQLHCGVSFFNKANGDDHYLPILCLLIPITLISQFSMLFVSSTHIW